MIRPCTGHRTVDPDFPTCSGMHEFSDEGYGVYGLCDNEDCTEWHLQCGTDHVPNVVIRRNVVAGYFGNALPAAMGGKMTTPWTEAERAQIAGVMFSLDLLYEEFAASEWAQVPLYRNGRKVLA